MRLRLHVEIVGTDWSQSSVWYTGDDAKKMQEMVNNLSELKQLSFHYGKDLVVLGPELLKKAVVTVEVSE